MTDEPQHRNGYEWRLRELEKWRDTLNREGTPGLGILKERHEALREQNKDDHAAIRERIGTVEGDVSELQKAWASAQKSALLLVGTGIVGLLVWLIQGGRPG